MTQAARTFADCVNRVRYQGASFILHKNGVAVARIVPVEPAADAVRRQRAVVTRDERDEVPQNEKIETATSPDDEEQHDPVQPATQPRRPVLNW